MLLVDNFSFVTFSGSVLCVAAMVVGKLLQERPRSPWILFGEAGCHPACVTKISVETTLSLADSVRSSCD